MCPSVELHLMNGSSAKHFLPCSANRFKNGNVGYCCAIGLENAGKALGGALGDFAKYIWGVGLLAAGQASTMTGTFAGQYVVEGFLKLKISMWKRLLITRSIALVPAMLVAIV